MHEGKESEAKECMTRGRVVGALQGCRSVLHRNTSLLQEPPEGGVLHDVSDSIIRVHR